MAAVLCQQDLEIFEISGFERSLLGRNWDWRYEVWPQTINFGFAPATAWSIIATMPAGCVRLNYDCTLQKALLALASTAEQ